MERQDAELEAALRDLDGNLPRGNPPDVHLDLGVLAPEPRDQRQQCVNGRFVRADEDAPALQIAQLAHRGLGLFAQPHQPMRIVQEKPAGLGQRPVFGRAVEQPLAKVVLQPPDRLTDGRLGPVQLGRSPRKAPLGRHREKHVQFAQVHGIRGTGARAAL